ncbi:MAG: twin-arginine translocase TatA/TatE family subunit [bacterium]|nr:MAG: twin-arginine translocase TatA/TatE family subunit [bacterium]
MFGIGPPELIVIFLIILILFGAKRLPELARSLGRSINEFKSATQNIKNDLDVSGQQDASPSDKTASKENAKKNSETDKSNKKDTDSLAG